METSVLVFISDDPATVVARMKPVMPSSTTVLTGDDEPRCVTVPLDDCVLRIT
jgi:hypothetical protein